MTTDWWPDPHPPQRLQRRAHRPTQAALEAQVVLVVLLVWVASMVRVDVPRSSRALRGLK